MVTKQRLEECTATEGPAGIFNCPWKYWFGSDRLWSGWGGGWWPSVEEALLVSQGFQRSWSAAGGASWPAATSLLCATKQSPGSLPMELEHIFQTRIAWYFFTMKSSWAADFLSKAQTSRVSPDWLWWGHSSVTSGDTELQVFTQDFCLFSHLCGFPMWTLPMTYSRDHGWSTPHLHNLLYSWLSSVPWG